MTISKHAAALMLMLAAVAATTPASDGLFAQDALSGLMGSNSPKVTGQGQASRHVNPTDLVLQVVILGRGETREAAIATLKQQRQTAATKLEELGAARDHIVFGPIQQQAAQEGNRSFGGRFGMSPSMEPNAAGLPDAVRKQMEAAGIPVPEGLDQEPLLTVVSTLTARLTIPSESADDVYIAAEKLESKIREMDLAGLENKGDLTDQQLEMAEESMFADAFGSSSSMNPYGMHAGEEPPPGTVQFRYVATLPDSERIAMMAEAIADARHNAEQLAEAADVRLGKLMLLSGGANGMSNTPMMPPHFGPPTGFDASELVDPSHESLTDSGQPVQFHANVYVAFAIAAP